jgi:hypothetical protein
MAMVLFQCYIEIDQNEYLDKQAEITKRSRASLIRDMIEKDKAEKEGIFDEKAKLTQS